MLHIDKFLDPFQSAYRSGFSTESALVKVHSDILHAFDNKKCVLLVLLDLSAAFDTVDHHILLSKLEADFKFGGVALSWFKSYLEHRSQTIQISHNSSDPHFLCYGVPQGSILGPVLFSLYTSALGKLISSHNIYYMLYADDTQLYVAFDPEDVDNAISRMESCIRDVRLWMGRHFLKLNEGKTKIIVFRSKSIESPRLSRVSLEVGDEIVETTPFVLNLGVYMDTHLTMDEHVKRVCQSTWYHIRQVGQLRKYLDRPAIEKLIHAVISSRLDYCNSLLFGVPATQLGRLQRIQNSAARIIYRVSKITPITPILNELHWLPINMRIKYKLLILVFRAVKTGTPAYISNMLQSHTTDRPSRTQYQFQLQVPKSRTKTFGDRRFGYAAPHLWNTLPAELRSLNSFDEFRRRLKTFLFLSK